MPKFTRSTPTSKPAPSTWGWGLGMALVLLATLFRAGNRHVPLLGLEWLALGVLGALILQRYGFRGSDEAPRRGGGSCARQWALGVLLTAPFWVAIWQLLPLPVSWLSGHAAYLQATSTTSNALAPWRSISLTPSDTWLSMLAGLPVVACLALALTASEEQLRWLLRAWIGVGVFQAVVGLLQLGFPHLRFEPNSSAPVLGTFGNRNGLANFFAMLLPLVLLMLFSVPGDGRRHGRKKGRGMRWLWGAALLLLVAGLLATLSRMGIATGALAAMLAVAWFGWAQPHGSTHRGWLLALPPALIAVALFAGGWDWLARFDTDRLVADDALRALNRASTWEAAQVFGPWGSGLGSFGKMFPAFQVPELGRWFVNFAHNDYLQFLMECGVLVLPLALAVLWLVAQRARQVWQTRQVAKGEDGYTVDALAVTCGLALLAQALHAWVDYPWRIPANAMLGAFMLGVFLREPKDRTTRKQHVK